MTIAVSLKVNDGLVLAADSAATLFNEHGNVVRVYNHANKVFNLRKGLPVGFISWGAGSIGFASISTLMKDLRRRLSGRDADHADWEINPNSYAVEAIAERVRQFIYDEHYAPAFGDWPEKPAFGCIIAGYSSGETLAEEYQIVIAPNGDCSSPQALRSKDVCGMSFNGEPEAIHRLVFGYGTGLAAVLEQRLGVPPDQVGPALAVVQQELTAQLLTPAMPIQDAIDLAEFLTELTVKFSRFTPGAATVGGPVEIAAITKHEGFKWVRRKFYYSRELNPEERHEPDHDR